MKPASPAPETVARVSATALAAARWHATLMGRHKRCARRACQKAGRCMAGRLHADGTKSPCGTPWTDEEFHAVVAMMSFTVMRHAFEDLRPHGRFQRRLARAFGLAPVDDDAPF